MFKITIARNGKKINEMFFNTEDEAWEKAIEDIITHPYDRVCIWQRNSKGNYHIIQGL